MAVRIVLKNSSNEDKRPTPAQLDNGEIALNYNEAGAFLTCKDTDGNIQQVGGVKISETAPDSPVKQTLWFQPSSFTLAVYDGDSFLPIAGGGDGGGGAPGGIISIVGNNGIDASNNNGLVTLDVDLHGGDDGLEFRDSKLKASVASASQLGSVKIGEGIDVDSTGTISVDIPQALNFRGSVDLNNPPTGQINPNPPELGDTYANTVLANPVDNGWTGIGGEVSQAGDLVVWDGSEWEIIGTGGTPDVDLGYTAAPNNGTVTNTAGDDAVIPIADDTNAGLFTAAEKTKLEGIEDGANVGMTEVNLTYTPNGDSDGTVENDAGTDATIPVAIASNSDATPPTAGVAGLFTGEEKEKLDGIEAGATNGTTNDGRYLRTDAAAGDQTVQSTGTTTFTGLTEHADGVRITGGGSDVDFGIYKRSDAGGLSATAQKNEGDGVTNFLALTVFPQVESVENTTSVSGVFINQLSNQEGSKTDTYYGFHHPEFSQSKITDSGKIFGFYSDITAKAPPKEGYNFYAEGTAPNFFKGDTYIGGSTSRNTRELWESTLTEEQKEQLSAGTLAIPANVATPGDGSFARQWWYDQQSAEDQALIDAGELDYPERLQAANFVDTFALGDKTNINLLSDGSAEFNGDVIIESTGKLLVGTSMSRNNYKFTQTPIEPSFQIEATSKSASLGITRNSDNLNPPCIYLGKTRGSQNNNNTIVEENDRLGIISFNGADGKDLTQAARIECEVDGTPGIEDMPGRITFLTTPQNSFSPEERVRITSDGKVGINTEDPQETLDVIGNIRAIREGAGGPATFGSAVGSGGASIRASSGEKATTFIDFDAIDIEPVENGGIVNYRFGRATTEETNGYSQIGMYRHNGTDSVAVIITSQARIGIGRGVPTEALDVVGNIIATGSITPNSVILRMESDNPAAYQTTFSTDEEGNQVEEETYVGTTEDLLTIIKDLRARVEALEAGATA
jgi:hypothetical protein